MGEAVKLNQPDVLFAPVMPDQHPDHIAAAELTRDARFEAKYHKTDMQGVPFWCQNLYSYYSTHRLSYDKPSFVVDISEHWNTKIEAICAYQSQLKNTSGNQVSLVEKIEVANRYFGQCIGVKYGEPFSSCEPLCVNKMELLA